MEPSLVGGRDVPKYVRLWVLMNPGRGLVRAGPLVRARNKQTKNLIREHEVEVDKNSGLVSILGGKWTTYRAMAEDTIDAVETQLNGSSRPSATRQHPLAGAAGYTPGHWKLVAEEYQLSEALARHLSGKFGMEARNVIAIAQEQNEYGSRLVEGMPAIQAEVVYCARREMAVTVEDVLASRLGLQYFDWKCAIGEDTRAMPAGAPPQSPARTRAIVSG